MRNFICFYTTSGGWYRFMAKEDVTQKELIEAKETLENHVNAGKGFYSDEHQTVFLKHVEAIVIEKG